MISYIILIHLDQRYSSRVPIPVLMLVEQYPKCDDDGGDDDDGDDGDDDDEDDEFTGRDP